MAHPLAPSATAAQPGKRVKPRLRGVSHQLALVALVPAVGWLIAQARGGPDLLGVCVYAASVIFLFATSALYHGRHWEEPRRTWLGRVDHAAIFVLIAGSFTPFGLRLQSASAKVALAALWLGALVGILLVARPAGVGKKQRSIIYVGLGLFVLPALSSLHALVGDGGLSLLCAAGALYIAGAAVYALRRPDPFPHTFGFHEIFHLLVIAAAACHFLCVAKMVANAMVAKSN